MYKNYLDADLITAYSTMMATSGKISSDLENVIEQRGGLDFFKRKINLRKTHPEEIMRITKEVQSLTTPDTDLEFVRNLVNSEFISKEDLDIFVKTIYDEYQSLLSNKLITKDTVLKSIAGLFTGTIASGLFWWGILIIFHQPFIFIIPVVYLIGYFIIKKITNQSTKNPVVLVSSLLSTLFGLSLGYFLYQTFSVS